MQNINLKTYKEIKISDNINNQGFDKNYLLKYKYKLINLIFLLIFVFSIIYIIKITLALKEEKIKNNELYDKLKYINSSIINIINNTASNPNNLNKNITPNDIISSNKASISNSIIINITKDKNIEEKNETQNMNIKKKRIGVVGIFNDKNIGNNLVKFSMFTKLKELGLDPIIVSRVRPNNPITFLKKYLKLKIVFRSFRELQKRDFDILMVNSDQTWSYSDYKNLFNYGLLGFARNWKIPKFIYGASLGRELWFQSPYKANYAKDLLKDFTGISFREIESISLVQKYLNIKSRLVLDPTLIIDKKYYLDLIKDYKRDFNFSEKYLTIYQIDGNRNFEQKVNEIKNKYNFKVFNITSNSDNEFYVEKFLFGINISQAVFTDSFHGTLFSILFDKPFISYISFQKVKRRFDTLNELFHLEKRIIEKGKPTNDSLLFEPIEINRTLLNILKNSSINYLKKNLGLE